MNNTVNNERERRRQNETFWSRVANFTKGRQWRDVAVLGAIALLVVGGGVFGLLHKEQWRDALTRELSPSVGGRHCGRSSSSESVACDVGLPEPSGMPMPEAMPDIAVGCPPMDADCCAAPYKIKAPLSAMRCFGAVRSPVRGAPRVRIAANCAEYAENEFLNPRSSPLSTFGLDVDTSSYAMMRSALMDMKRLPEKESVRLEEFVNSFKYDYPQPTGDEPIAVACELAACPWNAKHRLLRLGVQAKKVDDGKLPPCNLTFLVDVSGSMYGENRLELLKRGLKMLVGKLRPVDHVAIVTYANDAEVRLPSVSGREKGEILSVIDGLCAGGGTAGGAGIQLAYEEARKNYDKKANNRVILVTDGDFNIGISSPKELEAFIARKRKSGVFLTVLGVGEGNYQDANMKKLANAGNGNYAYLDSLMEAKKVLVNEFGGTLMTVAKDVKVQIEFNPAEVEGYRLLGYESRLLKARDFNDDKKDAGEIGAGHTMTAFYEIIPAGSGEMDGEAVPLKYQRRAVTERGEMFTVKMRYKKPNGNKSVLVERPHTEAEIFRDRPSEDFLFGSAVAEFALLLEDSRHKGDASFARLVERARSAKGADREGYRAEFIRLAEMAELYADPAAPQTAAKPWGVAAVDVEVDI